MDGDITRILKTATAEGGLPSEDLLPLVYDELRSLAALRMKGENSGHTLQATALVHEAWLRISGKGGRIWNDRAHFFRVAALEMRRILVDSARKKSSLKRGADQQHVDIHDIDLAQTEPNDRILLIDEMLRRLEEENPERARIVTLKFFGGLTDREISEMEGVSVRTVSRSWTSARTYLYEMMRKEL
ncbi:MAG: ECF-type sigma factor [Luteolibacter sp.]